jgi:ADP-ribose pyrophosphatase YjhB (NUDIX family)
VSDASGRERRERNPAKKGRMHAHPGSWKERLERTRFCTRCGGPLEWTFVPEAKRECKVCSRCGRVHFFNPKLAAGTLTRIDGRIVLLRRGIEPGYGLWTYPGGFVDLGESAQEAAVRETAEESGLHVEITGPAGVYTSDARDIVIVVFHARVAGGALHAADESLEARLFDPADIPWNDLAFSSTRQLLRDHFPGHALRSAP